MGCPTGLEPVTSCSTDKRSAIELRAPYIRRRRRECKPSSVRDGHLSRSRWDRPRRRLRDGSRLPTLASSLQAVESEIAAGRIALFTRARQARTHWSLLLSRRTRPPCRSGLSTHTDIRFPGFHRAPSLCAARTFLWPCQRPSVRYRSVSKARPAFADRGRWCRRGDLNSHALTGTTP